MTDSLNSFSLVSLAVSVLCGVASSFAFIFMLLWTLRPKVVISTMICHKKGEADSDGFLIKVVNKSLFSAFDVKASLEKYSPTKAPTKGKVNSKITSLNLIKSELSHVESNSFIWSKEKGDNALLFRTKENLTTILEDKYATIVFQITLKHGVSGLSRVFREEYSNTSSIQEGLFDFGNKTNIVVGFKSS